MTHQRFLTLSLITYLFAAACAENASMIGGSNAAGAAAPGTNTAAVGGDPLAGAYLAGAGIGVSDLDKSQEFYTTIFGMMLRYQLPVPGYANERIMYFKDGQGSDVVLINFTDGSPHNYTNNPAKLVFYVPSASAVIEMVRARGLKILSEPAPQAAFNNTVIGFGTDPDGYILEIIENPMLTQPFLGAIGLGVESLDKAKDFYTRVLGMKPMGDLLVVPNAWDEWILQHPSGKGSALVLMHFTDGAMHNYANNPLKTAHFVADSKALTARVAAEGLPILSQPMVFDVLGTKAMIGLARDPDGYQLEMVTSPAP